METLLCVREVCETMYVTCDVEHRSGLSYLQCVSLLSRGLDEIFAPLSMETLPILRSLRPSGPPLRSRSSTGRLLQLWQTGTQAQSVPAQRCTQGRQVSSEKNRQELVLGCLFQVGVICCNRPVSPVSAGVHPLARGEAGVCLRGSFPRQKQSENQEQLVGLKRWLLLSLCEARVRALFCAVSKDLLNAISEMCFLRFLYLCVRSSKRRGPQTFICGGHITFSDGEPGSDDRMVTQM